MLYTYMKSTSSARKSNAHAQVVHAWLGPSHEDLYILTRNEDRFCMPEVGPFDIACWTISQGEQVYVEDGTIALSNDQIRAYAQEHSRYWEPMP